MKIPSVSRRLMLSIVLLLYQGNHLAARNEGACKLNYDVYVHSNDLQCQDNTSDNDLSVIERYRPTKKFCTSNFDTTVSALAICDGRDVQSALSDGRGRASLRFGVDQRDPGLVSERKRKREGEMFGDKGTTIGCCLAWCYVFLTYHVVSEAPAVDANDVLVLTVASNETDGFQRYLRSVEVYGLRDNLKILGLGEPWRGGINMNYPGGGYKINLLKKALEDYRNDEKKIVLFTDSYDVIFLGGLSAIVERFLDIDARVLFSAEAYCWPDRSLADQYPSVSRGKRYLNSGGFIGYVSDVYEILDKALIKDEDDDQLFYTTIYLQDALRMRHKIKLDHKSEIFQNLNGAVADVELRFKGEEAYLQNIVYNTVPLILHGNGPNKLVLNSLGNYLAHAWTPKEGCLACWDRTIELNKNSTETYPIILIAIFIEQPTPFLEEFFQAIYRQAYPKSRLHLLVHNNVPYHQSVVSDFFERVSREYLSAKQISILPKDVISEIDARKLALEHCLLKECSGYLSVDAVAHLDNEHTLKLLVEQQRGIVAPLLIRPNTLWSNFWGAVTNDGFYARSFDYMEIIKNVRRGLWNVPFVSSCYLINATIIANKATRPSYEDVDLDTELAFAQGNRQKGLFMYLNNRLEFGHLVNPTTYDIQLTYPDMYQIMDNKLDWERRYIHPNYSENFNPDKKPIQPCPDVYWFPISTLRFTNELIGIVETYGQWSDGSNHDPRLTGGYESVPTRDIHMNQVQYEQQWLYFLKEYVRPLQELVFIGYYHDVRFICVCRIFF